MAGPSKAGSGWPRLRNCRIPGGLDECRVEGLTSRAPRLASGVDPRHEHRGVDSRRRRRRRAAGRGGAVGGRLASPSSRDPSPGPERPARRLRDVPLRSLGSARADRGEPQRVPAPDHAPGLLARALGEGPHVGSGGAHALGVGVARVYLVAPADTHGAAVGMQAAIKKYMFKDEKGMAEALAEAQEEFMRLSPARSRVSLLTVWYDPLRKSEPWVPLVHDQDFHRKGLTRVRVPAHASRWCSSMGQSPLVSFSAPPRQGPEAEASSGRLEVLLLGLSFDRSRPLSALIGCSVGARWGARSRFHSPKASIRAVGKRRARFLQLVCPRELQSIWRTSGCVGFAPWPAELSSGYEIV